MEEGVQGGIQRFDAAEAAPDEVAGRDVPPAQARQQLGGGGVDQGGYSVSMTGGTLKNPFS